MPDKSIAGTRINTTLTLIGIKKAICFRAKMKDSGSTGIMIKNHPPGLKTVKVI
jgi:hypothetical protein